MYLDSAAYADNAIGFHTGCGARTYSCFLPARETKEKPVYLFLKRLSDIILSLLALIVLAPLFLITALAIKLDSPGSVIYSQTRAGKNGKHFTIYKFRSMCEDADDRLNDLRDLNERDGPVFKIANDPRVTRVGRVIRKRSIDELPQLVNILKGEMSIVGPRPPLLNEVAQYTPEQAHRLDVKPGLTCYWQCGARSDLSFKKWMELDEKYIREQSLWTDFKIILKTVPAVLTGRE
jgi:lipopolysaccharide/colanic/teichoic acid biosynthesis glycosyltransferase